MFNIANTKRQHKEQSLVKVFEPAYKHTSPRKKKKKCIFLTQDLTLSLRIFFL